MDCSNETRPDVHAPDRVQNYRNNTHNSEWHADIGDLEIHQLPLRELSEEESTIVRLKISPALTIVIYNTKFVATSSKCLLN